MKYTKKEIGEALKNELAKGYSIERISNWAFNLFIGMREKRDPEVEDILNSISLMDAGPEFEYSLEELQQLAEMLVKEEHDPIKKIDSMTKSE